MLDILYKNTKSCRGTHSRERRGRNCCCKDKTFIWIVQGIWGKNVQVSAKNNFYLFLLPSRSHFYAKSVEMEAIFNRWWGFEIQNAASTNQSGATANHIVRFRGLDVILQRSLVLHPKQCGMVCIIVKLSEYWIIFWWFWCLYERICVFLLRRYCTRYTYAKKMHN